MTEKQVRYYFRNGFLHVHDGAEGDGMDEFDRWHAEEIRKAKAEAWDEGASMGRSAGEGAFAWNPYREAR